MLFNEFQSLSGDYLLDIFGRMCISKHQAKRERKMNISHEVS